MRSPWRIVPWALGVLVGAGLAFLLLSDAPEPDGPGAPYVVAETRLAAVQAASVLTLPGAHLLAVEGASEVSGDRSSCGSADSGGVTYATVLRRRLDVGEVATLGEPAGAVRMLLALARAQQEALESAGFNTMSADWATTGGRGRQRVTAEELASPLPPEPDPPLGTGELEQARPAYAPAGPSTAKVGHWNQSDSGGGGGGAPVNLLAPQIVHHRIYVIPKSGASLFVRNAYDQAARTVDVEFAYVDRTVFGVEVPTGSYVHGRRPGHYSVREELVSPP